jgi:hypothetical protein
MVIETDWVIVILRHMHRRKQYAGGFALFSLLYTYVIVFHMFKVHIYITVPFFTKGTLSTTP